MAFVPALLTRPDPVAGRPPIASIAPSDAPAEGRAPLPAGILSAGLLALARVRRGRLRWASPGLRQLLGGPVDAWADRPVAALFLRLDDAQAFARASAAVLAGGGSARLQAPLRRASGAPLWVDIGIAPLPGAEGELLLQLLDLSPLRAAQARRLRALGRAAQRRRLRDALRQQDGFLGLLSHELRTPLNAVLGFAALLQAATGPASGVRAGEAAQAAHYLAQIVASGEHLLALIDQLLEQARLQAGQLLVSQQAVRPGPLLRGLADARRAQAAAAGLQLVLEVDPGLGVVRTDPQRLRQMVEGLLDNALKFSRPGGLVLMRAGPDGPAHWQVLVADQGIGIAAADLPRLFSPFQQLSEGRCRSHGGLGLGLVLVRRLARALGGEVSVRSRPGEGSEFRLRLPWSGAAVPGAVGEPAAGPRAEPAAAQPAAVASRSTWR